MKDIILIFVGVAAVLFIAVAVFNGSLFGNIEIQSANVQDSVQETLP